MTVKFCGSFVNTRKTLKTWEKTSLKNLVHHKSGLYYARAYFNGKEFWQPLETSHFSMAEAKRGEFF